MPYFMKPFEIKSKNVISLNTHQDLDNLVVIRHITNIETKRAYKCGIVVKYAILIYVNNIPKPFEMFYDDEKEYQTAINMFLEIL